MMGKRWITTISLVLLALASMTAMTAAWFSIADFTRLSSISMTVTSGYSMRFDLDSHLSFDDYKRTLGFEEICRRIKEVYGYDPRETAMEPVTSDNGTTFQLQNGTYVQSDEGKYIQFTLHFIATEDMVVHLTSSSSEVGGEGTLFSANRDGVVKAMRMSFTADGETYIYDPDMGDISQKNGKIKIFGLPSEANMIYNDNNAMFSLQKDTDKPVVIRIWLEGTDENCVNAIKGAEYSIRLRFEGTDENNKLFNSR